MLAIFKKEVSIYFQTPFGYVFMGLFLLISGVVFTVYNLLGNRGDILGMLGMLNFVSIVIFPVLTMKLLSEEKKMGTNQLLFTAPVKISSIVLGKYFAAFFVFTVTLFETGIFALFMIIFGNVSAGAILGAYMGFTLLGGTYVAICLFASSLTENQVTSAIAGFGLLLSFMLVGFLSGAVKYPLLKSVLNFLAILDKYNELTNGILKTSQFVYYLSFIILFVFLTVRVVEFSQVKKAD
jgi:ABC-2 type transport system permease protein